METRRVIYFLKHYVRKILLIELKIFINCLLFCKTLLSYIIIFRQCNIRFVIYYCMTIVTAQRQKYSMYSLLEYQSQPKNVRITTFLANIRYAAVEMERREGR